MANPFDKTPPALQPKRNTFDLSFANNLTLPIGKLIPVMCEEVLPGDTFKIQPDFGIRFQPMAFPVQTRMRCDIHFFYCRNRNLWKNWKKFIGRTDEDVVNNFPVIAEKPQGSDFFQVGSLADYLGVPTTYAGRTNQQTTLTNYNPFEFDSVGWYGFYRIRLNSDGSIPFGRDLDQVSNSTSALLFFPFNFEGVTSISFEPELTTTDYARELSFPFSSLSFENNTLYIVKINGNRPIIIGAISRNDGSKVITPGGIKDLASLDGLDRCCLASLVKFNLETLQTLSEFLSKSELTNEMYSFANMFNLSLYTSTESVVTTDKAAEVFSPDVTPISALPFRCYEYIYNAFYRNEQVDPLIIDGKPEYDVFLENMEDGPDNFAYQLRERYWEKDPFTTALPSPQMGDAPLVGGRIYGEQQQQQNVRGTISTNEGDDISVLSSPDGQLLQVGAYNNSTPISTLEALQDAINFGISINDFRNVSALQQWLEINVRRGYRYKEQIMSHFGVNVSYEELDMPEFIGAISRDVNVSTIYNQTSEGGILGDYAGVASALGQSKYKISKYCDEHGFIMAIMSISPIPTYPQMLKKHFTKLHPFDYFFPEFGHIGLQPIPIRELSPLQVEAQAEAQNETFGYQRAWYEYVGKVDEVHGQFRTDMKNYLITRNFISAPQLDGEFLKIKEDEVNDVFVYTKGTDKALGQVYFKITAKRPIPYFGTPRIV